MTKIYSLSIYRFHQVLLALFGPLMLISYKIVVIPFILMGILTIPIHRFSSLRKSKSPQFWSIILFFMWCGVSLFWSYNQLWGAIEYLKILPIVFCGFSFFSYAVMLEKKEQQSLLCCFAGGVVFLFYLFLVDQALGYKIAQWKKWSKYSIMFSMVKSYQQALLLGVCSFGLVLSQIKLSSKVNLILTLLSSVLLFSMFPNYGFDAAGVALGCYLIGFIFTFGFPIVFPKLIRFGFFGVILLSPVLVKNVLTPTVWEKLLDTDIDHSHVQRLEILEWGAQRIYEKPIQGYGFQQLRKISCLNPPKDYRGFYDEHVLEGEEKRTYKNPGEWRGAVCHMHNGFMQIWLETGLIGALLIASFIFFALKTIEGCSLSRVLRAHTYASILAVSLFTAVSFGLWETWWLSTLFLLLILFWVNVVVGDRRG